ncbi:MAG: radical SAM protein, partial [Phycisphaerae bacterium]|nr:radical SAM protein [Phycisphaerae bacterium]
HLTVATNGTLLVPDTVERMVEAGIRYAEVSIDSLDMSRHDRFRGQKGYWRRTVDGLRNVIKAEGIKSGLAMTVMRWNVDELPDIIDWAINEGVETFYAFNFIPTGRARDVLEMDLTPEQRERMLVILQEYLTRGEIAIMSSAPQFGRACLEYGGPNSPVNTGHYGKGGGKVTRILARYVGGCGAGRCYCAIQPNGKVTPCVFMPVEVGDLRSHAFEKIWFDSPVMQLLRDRDDRIDHCRICDYKYVCGGCRARSLGYFDDLRRGDPGCKFNVPRQGDTETAEKALRAGMK